MVFWYFNQNYFRIFCGVRLAFMLIANCHFVKPLQSEVGIL